MKVDAPLDGTKDRMLWFIVLSLVLWAIPFVIGFAAALLWQGLVIGWQTCIDFMGRA